jgi:hypothetical protein
MLFYFLIFTVLGFVIRRKLNDKGVQVIIILAIVWGLISGPIWGLASLGELFLGYYIAQEVI